MYKSKTHEEILLEHHDKVEKNRELSEANFKILNDKILDLQQTILKLTKEVKDIKKLHVLFANFVENFNDCL